MGGLKKGLVQEERRDAKLKGLKNPGHGPHEGREVQTVPVGGVAGGEVLESNRRGCIPSVPRTTRGVEKRLRGGRRGKGGGGMLTYTKKGGA